ncbi:MAG: hypothetical protein GX591_14955 [Planctomycetes bacterium]|nr:hypothetical protein [Planctomycetota bacterium]
MDTLEKHLRSMRLPEPPLRLDLASAFVVSVTPRQLRDLEDLDLVDAIRPNRTHRVGS